MDTGVVLSTGVKIQRVSADKLLHVNRTSTPEYTTTGVSFGN